MLSIYSTKEAMLQTSNYPFRTLRSNFYPIGLDQFFLSLNNKINCYVPGIHQISTAFIIRGVKYVHKNVLTVFHCSNSMG